MPVTDLPNSADTRIWLCDPGHNLNTLVWDFEAASIDDLVHSLGTITVTAKADSNMCLASYNGSTAGETDFGWNGTDGFWSLRYYHRGVKKVAGPIVSVVKHRDGQQAKVTITAESAPGALLRRRQVRTELGNPWTATDGRGDLCRQLGRTNCETGSVVTPTGWQESTETRDDFGVWSVTFAADDETGSEEYTCENRKNLLDAILECANTGASDAERQWMTWTEPSAGTCHIDFEARNAVGSSYTDSIVFSSARGNMPRYSKTIDGAGFENHLVSGAKGAGQRQSTHHKADTASILTSNHGVFEGVYDVPAGMDAAEVTNELERRLWELRDGITTIDFTILEQDGSRYAEDWDAGDTFTAFDKEFGESHSEQCIGVRIVYDSPGPHYTISPILGQFPRNELRQVARAGGGGGGGRGGGGRSRNPDGSRFLYYKFSGDSGDAEAHELDTEMNTIGENTTEVVRCNVVYTDTSTEGNPDEGIWYVEGPFEESDVTVSGYVAMNKIGGGTVYLLAADTITPK